MNENFFFNKYSSLIIIVILLILSNVDVSETMTDSYLYTTTPEKIKQNGYPAETHIVQTQDGYLLEVHRIPSGKSGTWQRRVRYPVLLCHEFLGSSYDWVLSEPNKSLGFQLADQGYDVWLANARGNAYSKGHIILTQMQPQYWNFSFHEMGIYDMPATIDYILNITKHDKLIMICHSMGNTAFYVMASSLPHYNSKVTTQISLAPIGAIPHTTSALRLLSLFRRIINLYSTFLSSGSILQSVFINGLFTNTLCNYIDREFCNRIIIAPMFGSDPYQFDRNLIPPYFSHVPSGTSLKTLVHFGQLVNPGIFGPYDYGPIKNKEYYGAIKPPEYNLSNIKVPIRAYYGDGDNLATPKDTRAIFLKFPNPLELIRVNSSTFNHIDFLGAIDINPLLNDDLIYFLHKLTDSMYFGK